ncbi:conserved hypothetical protein [Bradyrhizobium sp. ORS 285]|nr:conserved hypothetical protein [Bradyrhizobium sp. ORS 285]
MAASCRNVRKCVDERHGAGGQVAWSRHPDAGVQRNARQRIVAMVANKPAHQGEREAADKPTAQGMPDDRLNLWYLPPAFSYAGGPWVAASTRHSLRPLRRREGRTNGITRA